MSNVTYFVVLPFERTGKNKIRSLDPIKAKDAHSARTKAEKLAAKGGAIAFSRTGDPETGDFNDAVVLAQFGQVPDVEALA